MTDRNQTIDLRNSSPDAATSPAQNDNLEVGLTTPKFIGSAYDPQLSLWQNYCALRDAARASINPILAEELREIKGVLCEGRACGPNSSTLPFRFWSPAGEILAQGSGLEGFLYNEQKVRERCGEHSLMHHLNDYFQYLEHVLGPSTWAANADSCLRAFRNTDVSAEEKYTQVIEFVANYVEELQLRVLENDPTAWAKSARIYTVFSRAFNINDLRQAHGIPAQSPAPLFRTMSADDLNLIRFNGAATPRFDTLWLMGIFPLGERGALGDGGGSPYSIRDHGAINPELGSKEDLKNLVAAAHGLGMKVIIDLVPNHASLDSVWLEEHPEYFIHQVAPEGCAHEPPYGFFHHHDKKNGRDLWVRNGGYNDSGTLRFWPDVAQFNYANPEFRQRLVDCVMDWVSETGVDGFRVDMAHGIFNHNFQRNWGLRTPETEFFAELISAVREKHPHVAFIAEAYDSWDEISKAGFDLVYLKNDMARNKGCFHSTWYDAIRCADPSWIRAGIARLEFLRWQVGGSDGTVFFGNQDEPAPQIVFGPWWKGAAFLTLMVPGSMLFYGSQEIGFSAHDERYDLKPLPFTKRVNIDWKNPNPEAAAFFQETFALAARYHQEMGLTELVALNDSRTPCPRWAGFALRSPDKENRCVAVVLVNPTDRETDVIIDDPRLNLHINKRLPAYGYMAYLPSEAG